MSKWLVWTHDPCPEGGWHIYMTCDTLEDATIKLKEKNEQEKRRFKEYNEEEKERIKEIVGDGPVYVCYDEGMITPEAVLKVRVDE